MSVLAIISNALIAFMSFVWIFAVFDMVDGLPVRFDGVPFMCMSKYRWVSYALRTASSSRYVLLRFLCYASMDRIAFDDMGNVTCRRARQMGASDNADVYSC